MSTKFHRSGKNVLALNDAKAYMDHLTDAFLFINANYGLAISRIGQALACWILILLQYRG